MLIEQTILLFVIDTIITSYFVYKYTLSSIKNVTNELKNGYQIETTLKDVNDMISIGTSINVVLLLLRELTFLIDLLLGLEIGTAYNVYLTLELIIIGTIVMALVQKIILLKIYNAKIIKALKKRNKR